MSTPLLIKAFYERIWNTGDLAAIPDLLAEGFAFRGSLGVELYGHKAFADYVSSVRGSLSGYRCEVLDCVTEKDQAFAKMRFSGAHVGVFEVTSLRENRFTGSVPRCFVLSEERSLNCGSSETLPDWIVSSSKIKRPSRTVSSGAFAEYRESL